MTMANPEIIPVQAYDCTKGNQCVPPPTHTHKKMYSLDKVLVVNVAIRVSSSNKNLGWKRDK